MPMYKEQFFQTISVQHPQNLTTNPLQSITGLGRQSILLRCLCVRIYHMEHSISCLRWPGPFDSILLGLIQIKLPVKRLDCFQGFHPLAIPWKDRSDVSALPVHMTLYPWSPGTHQGSWWTHAGRMRIFQSLKPSHWYISTEV